MHSSILQYSALIKFVPTGNNEIHRFVPIERFSYWMPLQFLMAHMFIDAAIITMPLLQ